MIGKSISVGALFILAFLVKDGGLSLTKSVEILSKNHEFQLSQVLQL